MFYTKNKRHSVCVTASQTKSVFFLSGKPVMIVIEYMENGALDAFLRVSTKIKIHRNVFKVTEVFKERLHEAFSAMG